MKRILISCLFLVIIHSGIAQTIPNGGFENWSNGDPVGWVTYNAVYPFLGLSSPPVEMVTPAPEGNYAVKMTSLLNATTGETFPGFCYLGNMDPLTGTGSIGVPFSSLGFPFSSLPPMFTGKFQHHVANPGDTAIIACVFTKWDPVSAAQTEVSVATMISTDEVPNWTDFSVPFFTNVGVGDPDSMSIYLFSMGGDGATLSLDQLAFGGAVNVSKEQTVPNDILLFPNPASEEIWIESTLFGNENIQVSVYDMSGQLVEKMNWNSGGLRKMDITSMPSGTYVVELKSSQQTKRRSFVKR
jgi:Secretion system C-terminal sorting domain